jgi:hypothetical protein
MIIVSPLVSTSLANKVNETGDVFFGSDYTTIGCNNNLYLASLWVTHVSLKPRGISAVSTTSRQPIVNRARPNRLSALSL